jgi:hypothetical protein
MTNQNPEFSIAAPCDRNWREFARGDRKRFCADCKTFVQDMTALTEQQARAMLASPQDICVRFVYDELGHAVFADSYAHRPVPAAALLRKWVATTVAAVATTSVMSGCLGVAMGKRPNLQPAGQPVLVIQRDNGQWTGWLDADGSRRVPASLCYTTADQPVCLPTTDGDRFGAEVGAAELFAAGKVEVTWAGGRAMFAVHLDDTGNAIAKPISTPPSTP